MAVLKLAKPVPDAVTVTLADGSLEMERGQRLKVVGWGKTEAGQSSQVLEHADVEHMAPNQCPADYNDVMCAGNTGANTCNGDSGGPLLMEDPKSGDWVQVGITSHGPDCLTGNPILAYGFYSDVRLYREDILATLAAAAPPLQAPGPSPGPSPGNNLTGGTTTVATGETSSYDSGDFTCLDTLNGFQSDTDLQGGSLTMSDDSVVSSAGPEDCCQSCARVEACFAWTWSASSSNACGGPCCFLKAADGWSAVAAPGAISGAWYR